jgi:hypothetical protein
MFEVHCAVATPATAIARHLKNGVLAKPLTVFCPPLNGDRQVRGEILSLFPVT